MNYLKTTEKVAVENYPYGFRSKTTAYFSIEHKSGKGFRTVFQTVNPKTGLLNKPKHSTYSPVRVLKNTDGMITSYSLDFYGDDGLVRDLKFMNDNFNLFTQDEIKSIALNVIAILRGNIYAKVVYTHSDQTKLLPLFDSVMTAMVDIAKTGQNLFGSFTYDIAAIKALEVVGFNPFKVTSSN